MVGALPFQFGTLNVRGLRRKRQQGQLLHLFSGSNVDVVPIEEPKIL